MHGGFIQFSGLYAFASEWIATEPSALNTINRKAGASRAPSRPAYSTEHWVTIKRTDALYHAPVDCAGSVRDRPAFSTIRGPGPTKECPC